MSKWDSGYGDGGSDSYTGTVDKGTKGKYANNDDQALWQRCSWVYINSGCISHVNTSVHLLGWQKQLLRILIIVLVIAVISAVTIQRI